MILKLTIILLLLIIAVTVTGYYRLFRNNKNIQQDLSKIYIAIKRLRYGDIHIRVEDLYDKKVEKAVNRLFETISDREMMIKEYQNTLSDKNLSLEKILKQEQEMQQVKKDFTATLAHDMKVPVIGELNSIKYLLEGRFGELNEKQTEILKLMQTSNTELKELIENMLEIYKIEQKEIQLNLIKTNLNEFISNTAKEMHSNAFENGMEIICNTENTADLEIPFDNFQFKRVIKNLIQNAILYSQKNDEIKITTEKTEDSVKIFITNKGTGISKEDLNLIFQKYYSGNSKFHKSGTGLGLYISRQIMLAHKGNIEVDTSKTDYTTFILTLPLLQ